MNLLEGRIIGFDMDGVLADWVGGMLAGLKSAGHDIDRQACTTYHLANLTPEQRHIMRSISCKPDFFYQLTPIWGAIATAKHIAAQGAHIIFVTTPYRSNPLCYDEKIQWICKYFGSNYRDNVVFTHDKTLVMCDVLLDDKPVIHGTRTPFWKRVIVDAPYNQNINGMRISNWDHLTDIPSLIEFCRQ